MTSILIIAVVAVMLFTVIKNLGSEFPLLGGVYVTLALTCGALCLFSDFISGIKAFFNMEQYGYLALMLKIAGVSICADVGSDICAQMGYVSVAKSIVLYGKVIILIMAVPVVEELLAALSSFSLF